MRSVSRNNCESGLRCKPVQGATPVECLHPVTAHSLLNATQSAPTGGLILNLETAGRKSGTLLVLSSL
jgi:hypothetical protein